MVNGVHIDIKSDIPQLPPPPPLVFTPDEKAAQEQIETLLAKNAIVLSHREQGDHLSNIFLRPKKSGGFRMILNLKNFSKFVDKIKFKMETSAHFGSGYTKLLYDLN